jgi:hypothetical protein
MKKIKNTEQSVFKPLEHKRDKAQEVFWKLYARNNGKRNPFDDIGTETLPIKKDVKPGADDI